MPLDPLPERLVRELGEATGGIAIDVVESFKGSAINTGSKLERLPGNLILGKDGSVRVKDRNRGATCPASIDELFTLLDNVIQINARNNDVAWLQEDGQGQKRVPFVRYGQEEEMQTPFIAMQVQWGKPGAFGKGKEMAPSARQRNPILRDVVMDPHNVDSEIFIFTHRFDYWIELEVGGSTAKEADMIRSWLETTLANNMWYLKYSGIVEFLFSERLADTTRKIEGKTLHCRPLKYYVQTEQLSWYRLQTLKELCLTLQVET